jgi:hypothetical protein
LDHKLAGVQDLNTQLGKQNLVIEFDYEESAVDKVSYHIGEESGKFYLTIKPKKGSKPLDKSRVDFTYAGADADLIFLVGVHDLETLDQLYFGYEPLYENAFVVTLNSFKPELGNVQIDLSGGSSLSESLVGLLTGLEIPVTEEMATNLLRGIEQATDNLQSFAASADTFEVVAKLLRSGARRAKAPVSESISQPSETPQPVARTDRRRAKQAKRQTA